MTTTLTPLRTTDIAPATAPARHARPRLALALAAEVAVMGTVFVAYRQVRHLSSGDTGQAMDNATRVVELERRLHVFSEQAIQRLALHSELVVGFLNRYYVAVHFPATIAMLVWAFCRHRAAYGRIRAAFLGVTLAALVIHVIVPLAPPRMLRGFVDTLDVYGPQIYPSDTTQSVANQFAAMPSLHFGWAAARRRRRHRRGPFPVAPARAGPPGHHPAGDRRHRQPLLARRRRRSAARGARRVGHPPLGAHPSANIPP